MKALWNRLSVGGRLCLAVIAAYFLCAAWGGARSLRARLADETAERILAQRPAAVLCQGEFTLAFAVTERLKAKGVTVLAASSDRALVTEEDENGGTRKVTVFRFVRFRKY